MSKSILQETQYFKEGLFRDGFYPVQPDEWQAGGWKIREADSFDSQYFGFGTLRIDTGHETIPTLPIKIYVTGRTVQYTRQNPRIRIEVEFLRDGESSVWSGGWLWLARS